VAHESLVGRAREIAATIAAIPAEYVRELRRGYEKMQTLSGDDALAEENRWSRRWMEERFDQARLTTEREKIVARGREQNTGLDGAPA